MIMMASTGVHALLVSLCAHQVQFACFCASIDASDWSSQQCNNAEVVPRRAASRRIAKRGDTPRVKDSASPRHIVAHLNQRTNYSRSLCSIRAPFFSKFNLAHFIPFVHI
ncbi:unnamed protein product [Toxocara canis]|uniref:Secreted protein n=1 Tax=Toxocara canis TaxID=6265 RepID=A0A183UZG5_TOXCA|nr:unnamed protein product [Toxocara canis]